MLADLKLAIRLQEIDNLLVNLQREIAALPVHISVIEKKLVSHERKLEADRAALAANQKERKQSEGEIQTWEQKISKLKGQMVEAKTNEQYRAFQSEIDFCQTEIRKLEDRILDLMGESEPLDRNVKSRRGRAADRETAGGGGKEQRQRAHGGGPESRGRTATGARPNRAPDDAGGGSEIRAGAQGAQGDRRGGSGGWPLHGVQHGAEAAILPGPEERRPDSCPAKAASGCCTTIRRFRSRT